MLLPGFRLPAILLAGLVAIAAPSLATAQDAVLIPVAPPENAELSYNIPLQPWLVPTVLELKVQFVDGLSAEFGGIAESQTGEDLGTLVEAGGELAEAASHMRSTINAIGELDVTFGIEGISRIIPAESAMRDTLFGFVVWHEFSSTPARGMMTRFEGLVEQVAAGGEASGDLAAGLASARQQLEEAVEQGDSRRIAELTPGIIEASRRIDAVCTSVAVRSDNLSVLVDSLSMNSGEMLAAKWGAASEAVDATREPATRTGPALESMSGVLDLLVGLGGLVELATASMEALTAAPDPDGNLYIPWTFVRTDWEVARDLKKRVVDEPHEGEEVDEHDHADHGYIGGAASDATRARIDALLTLQVEANAILAARAVSHTSAVVAASEDALEQLYLDREGYSSDLSERRQESVFAEVDENMRKSLDLVAAKMSATAARRAMGMGRDHTSVGSDVDALYNYHNAWLHCLNAGASALRVTGEAWYR